MNCSIVPSSVELGVGTVGSRGTGAFGSAETAVILSEDGRLCLVPGQTGKRKSLLLFQICYVFVEEHRRFHFVKIP